MKVIDIEHYGSVGVTQDSVCVCITTKNQEIAGLGETEFALFPGESKRLRKALKKAEKAVEHG